MCYTNACHMTLHSSATRVVDELKYLGMYIVSAKYFNTDTHRNACKVLPVI